MYSAEVIMIKRGFLISGSNLLDQSRVSFIVVLFRVINLTCVCVFAGAVTPICVVSGAQFLTRGGWVDLHNNSYTEPPFRLFRDEGRTFLQWLGEVDLRFSMEGRLMLVHLMCKDVGSNRNGQDQTIFTPCVAFRVAGTPTIGVCSILLGLIYVASVFLYLHVRRRRKETCLREKDRDICEAQPVHLSGAEEGVIKSNPLLAAKRHLLSAAAASINNDKDNYLSDSASCCSDTDAVSDIVPASDDSTRVSQNVSTRDEGRGLSVTEYIAIGVCSILLGLIYVASVFLYLHVRRRRKETCLREKDRDICEAQPVHLSGAEEGVIKSNPLLAAKRHLLSAAAASINNDKDNYLSDSASCCSDTDAVSDIVPASDDSTRVSQNVSTRVQVTAAMVHSCGMSFSLQNEDICFSESIQSQEPSTIERLPEENVSIVETLEGREERPETAPPPAALEFLTKIREVIAIAKHKMLAKRFAPTLLGIPEEEQLTQGGTIGSYFGGRSSNRGSISAVSLKRENSRRRGCPDCPGCSAELEEGLPLEQTACQSCCNPIGVESKQSSIRKWLEDVPVGKSNNFKSADSLLQGDNCGVRKLAEAKPVGVRPSHKGRAPAIPTQDEIPKRNKAVDSAILAVQKELTTKHNKLIPAPPPPPSKTMHLIKEIPPLETKEIKAKAIRPATLKPVTCPPPPPLPSPTKSENSDRAILRPIEKKKKEPGQPVVTKKLMDAVIKELVGQRGIEPVKPPEKEVKPPINKIAPAKIEEQRKSPEDYEADSLERFRQPDDRGLSTPTDYGDVSSQPSPTLSSALPLEEVLTMRNEIFNIRTGNKTISKLKLDNNENTAQEPLPDDHEYEIIVLNPEAKKKANKDIKLYSLPELLNHNDGYSLVSEVYVNDGYNFGSASSSPSNTSSSSSSNNAPKIRYSEPVDKPGHLTIQVEDSPENYIQYPDDSDSFEPDTLDRKPNKHKQDLSLPAITSNKREIENFNDSLERPAQILLRTTGSFRSDSLSQAGSDDLSQILTTSPLNRAFGSLREIYEARTQQRTEMDNVSLVGSTRSLNSELDHTHSWRRNQIHYTRDAPRSIEGVLLNPEAKQAKRQRPPTPPGSIVFNKPEPPDVIPPLPTKTCALYEDPPPPRPLYKIEPTPPLPPRSIKPPLPPKNGSGRSTRMVSNPARRPLPPLPTPKSNNSFAQDISTMSSISTTESRDMETLSNLSGASVDSLNSSDYEAFYMAPFSGDEEQDGSQTLGHRVERSLKKKFANSQDNVANDEINSQFILHSRPRSVLSNTNGSNSSKLSKNSVKQNLNEEPSAALENRKSFDKDLLKHMRDKKGADSVKKTWRRMIETSVSKVPQKPEDSGYLSTDSNESNKRQKVSKVSNTETETQNSSQGQGSVSETDESLCDGASESGAESIATDSFFFGSFRKLSACAVVTESVDSGVGSDLVRTVNNSTLLEDAAGSSSDSENVSFVTVLPPGSGRRRSSVRC
ncbi:hypothetical protein C0J52_08109 [Blattella germanica]|nr:hypothetical protein C0J52_08109 [Blattella germanica]